MTQSLSIDDSTIATSELFSDYSLEQSKFLIPPLLTHLINSNTLNHMCWYSIDCSLISKFCWDVPDPQLLYWRYSIKDQQAYEAWLNNVNNKFSLDWHIMVSCATYSAAKRWFDDCLDELYIQNRPSFEFADCTIIDFGSNKGLAEEAYMLSLDNNENVAYHLLDSHKYTTSNERISLNGSTHPLSLVVSSSVSGSLIPPLSYGSSWVLIQVSQINKPKKSDLEGELLINAFLQWKNESAKSLTDFWINEYIHSQAIN